MPVLVPDQKYWEERSLRILAAGEKDGLSYEKDLKTAYQAATLQIQKEIDAFYARYAKKNEISLADARLRLKPDELKNFQQQAKHYYDEMVSLGEDAFTEPYRQQLRQLSGKAYVSRMQELQTNIQHNIEKMSVGKLKTMDKALTDAYQDSYYTNIFGVSQTLGNELSFTMPGAKQLEKAVKERWLGDNYSNRIWQDKQKLINSLDPFLSQEFVRGRSPTQVGKDFAKRMGVSESNAIRLIRTEMNYISNKGTLDSYKAAGIEEYRYVATLDMRTSEICREMDSKVFPVAEAKAGINYPPLHPYCRSTTIAYFPNGQFGEGVKDRVARDAQGRSVKLGKDVNFYQWAKENTPPAFQKRVEAGRAKFGYTTPALAPLVFSAFSSGSEIIKFVASGKLEESVKTGYSANQVMDSYVAAYSEMMKKQASYYVTNPDTGQDVLTIPEGMLDMDYAGAFSDTISWKVAQRLGIIEDSQQWQKEPFALDMAFNGVTLQQAKNRVFFGQPYDKDIKEVGSSILSVAGDRLWKKGKLDPYSRMINKYAETINFYSGSMAQSFHGVKPNPKTRITAEEALEVANEYFKYDKRAMSLGDKKPENNLLLENPGNLVYAYENLLTNTKMVYPQIDALSTATLKLYSKGKFKTIDAAVAYEQKKKDAAKKKAEEKKQKQAEELAEQLSKVEARKVDNDEDVEELKKVKLPDELEAEVVDKVYRKWTAAAWNAATKEERSAAHNYTSSASDFNWALSRNKDFYDEVDRKKALALYNYIDKSPIAGDIAVRRGGTIDELIHRETGNLLSVSVSGAYVQQLARKIANDSVEDQAEKLINNPKAFVGQVIKVPSFLSTSSAAGKGFDGEVTYKIILPKGTKATYAEPYSAYSLGKKSGYGGETTFLGTVGGEAEFIVQAGTKYIITDIRKPTAADISSDSRVAHSKLYIEMIAIPESQTEMPEKLKKPV